MPLAGHVTYRLHGLAILSQFKQSGEVLWIKEKKEVGVCTGKVQNVSYSGQHYCGLVSPKQSVMKSQPCLDPDYCYLCQWLLDHSDDLGK